MDHLQSLFGGHPTQQEQVKKDDGKEGHALQNGRQSAVFGVQLPSFFGRTLGKVQLPRLFFDFSV